jgi:hypothetical protein
MKQMEQKIFTLTIAVTLLFLPGMAFADNEKTGQSQTYTQIKPEPPQEQRVIPDRFPPFTPNRDLTLLADPSQMQPPAPVSEYWIGVQCGEIMPALRYHLNLDEQAGILVEQIVPESPAAKAGVEQYDVILAVNGKPVREIADIIKTVEEIKDGELMMSVIRKGGPMELKITPEKRPDSAKMPTMPPRQRMYRSIEPGVIIEEMTPGMPQQEVPEHLRRMLEQMQKQMEEQMRNFPESGGFRFEAMPGFGQMPIFGGPAAGTNTIHIAIEPARGDVEATLTVRKNGQTWSVSQFSDLPEHVQNDVAEVLENTVDGKDVAEWVAEQMQSNRRMTFSVTVSGNAQETE